MVASSKGRESKTERPVESLPNLPVGITYNDFHILVASLGSFLLFMLLFCCCSLLATRYVYRKRALHKLNCLYEKYRIKEEERKANLERAQQEVRQVGEACKKEEQQRNLEMAAPKTRRKRKHARDTVIRVDQPPPVSQPPPAPTVVQCNHAHSPSRKSRSRQPAVQPVYLPYPMYMPSAPYPFGPRYSSTGLGYGPHGGRRQESIKSSSSGERTTPTITEITDSNTVEPTASTPTSSPAIPCLSDTSLSPLTPKTPQTPMHRKRKTKKPEPRANGSPSSEVQVSMTPSPVRDARKNKNSETRAKKRKSSSARIVPTQKPKISQKKKSASLKKLKSTKRPVQKTPPSPTERTQEGSPVLDSSSETHSTSVLSTSPVCVNTSSTTDKTTSTSASDMKSLSARSISDNSENTPISTSTTVTATKDLFSPWGSPHAINERSFNSPPTLDSPALSMSSGGVRIGANGKEYIIKPMKFEKKDGKVNKSVYLFML